VHVAEAIDRQQIGIAWAAQVAFQNCSSVASSAGLPAFG
jgi:hypothetical protein